MRTALCFLILAAAACKPSKPMVEAVPAAEPAAESPMEQNKAEKYVSALQADVKRAQEAKEKADAATKKMADSRNELQQAEGQ